MPKPQRKPEPEPERRTGTVKWFDDSKGFGFITPEGLSPSRETDIFVHASEIVDSRGGGTERRSLADGEHVEYEIGTGPKGPCAVNVVSIA